MTGGVELVAALVDDGGALAEKLVDNAAYRVLVPRYRRGGDYYLVTRSYLNVPVLAKGHLVQGGHRLALAPGGDYHRLLLRKTLDLVYVNQNALRHVHVSELGADPEDVLHAAPGNSDLAPVLFGAVYHLLQPVHVRGKGGYYDALGAVLELVFKIRGYDALGEGVARVLDVGGVGDEGENAALIKAYFNSN